jgi:two-component system, chemotaxis family, chemotaxis protein CheY
MRSLIVEDDLASNLVLTKLLGMHGETVSAMDGEAGLDAFRKGLEEGRPFDLVTLDIMMPKLDGQAVLKGLRAFEDERKVDPAKAVKVIMTTALADKENIIEALPRCDAYLQKPISRTELLFYIKQFGLLSEGEAQALAERERKRKETGGQTGQTGNTPWVG